MKFTFLNGESLESGIAEVAEELGFTAVTAGADLTVHVTESEADSLTVKLDGRTASITYGGGKSRFFRALAILV